MRYFGREGIERILRSHIAMAQEFAAWVDADPRFERVAPVPFSVVCFRYKGSDEQNKEIMDAVNAGGKVFLSNTVLNGKFVLRIAIGNLGTSMDDVKTAWQSALRAGPQSYNRVSFRAAGTSILLPRTIGAARRDNMKIEKSRRLLFPFR